MTIATRRQNLISELRVILEGREGPESAITAGEMARMFGFRDDRIIRLAIEKLIDEGEPIVSDTDGATGGYFIPTSLEEARQYTKSLQSRAVKIFLRRRKIIRNAAAYLKAINEKAAREWLEKNKKTDERAIPEQGRLSL